MMDLSEAIRLGALVKPQGYGDYQTEGKSCALGAALDAVGIHPIRQRGTRIDQELRTIFPVLNRAAMCPVCAGEDVLRAKVDGLIIHLNDWHRWTRPQIADWVATVEQAQVSVVSRPEAVAVPA